MKYIHKSDSLSDFAISILQHLTYILLSYHTMSHHPIESMHNVYNVHTHQRSEYRLLQVRLSLSRLTSSEKKV